MGLHGNPTKCYINKSPKQYNQMHLLKTYNIINNYKQGVVSYFSSTIIRIIGPLMEPNPKKLENRNVIPNPLYLLECGNRSHNYTRTRQVIQVSGQKCSTQTILKSAITITKYILIVIQSSHDSSHSSFMFPHLQIL